MNFPEKIVVHIPEYFEEDVSKFVANRKTDVSRISELLEQGDYDAIRAIGHNMKGNGYLYHLNAVSFAGEMIEDAAIAKDDEAVRENTTALSEYLDHLVIIADLKEKIDTTDDIVIKIPEIRTILVDDSEATRDALARILEKTPLDVVGQASNGHDAIELCAALGPQLVLLDVLMPGGMSGLDVLETIKQTSPGITVVMVTSISGRKTVLRAKELGAYDYILKPFDRAELTERVNRLCETLAKENQ